MVIRTRPAGSRAMGYGKLGPDPVSKCTCVSFPILLSITSCQTNSHGNKRMAHAVCHVKKETAIVIPSHLLIW